MQNPRTSAGWLATLGCTLALQGAFAQTPPRDATPITADQAPGVDGYVVVDIDLPAKPQLMPPSIEFGIEFPYVPSYGREPIDLVATLNEDAADAASGDKSLRYGLRRDLPVRIKDGEWYTLPNDAGRVWVVELYAPEAVGLRVRFADLDLPDGAAIFAYSLSHPEIVAGPFYERGPLANKEAWTQTLFGERVRIEYRTPMKDYPAEFEPFFIDHYQHIYRDLASPAIAGQAACPDAMCLAAAWDAARRASSGIGNVGSNSLYCSGTMLATTAGDNTPLFMTANHCLSTAGAASSAEIYYLYQRAACDSGTIPSLASVPQAAPCTLVSTSATSDYTLLMVEGTMPNPRSNYGFAGWQSGNIANGTTCTGIHHPAGNYKRYAPGSKQADDGPCASDDINIDWNASEPTGGTEPGSSGSGVFRNSDQRWFGQLHCGPSSCESPSSDGYGEGEATLAVAAVSAALATGSDDGFEDNDTCATAENLAPGTYTGLIIKYPDGGTTDGGDWYRFKVPTMSTITVDLSFTHSNGDVDTTMSASCGGTQLDGSFSVGNTENLTWANTASTAQDVYVRVYLFSDFRNSYNMTVAVTCPAGSIPASNSCANAIATSSGGTYSGNILCATNDGTATCGASGTNRDVWYEFTAPAACAGTLTVDTCGTHDIAGTDTGMDTVLSLHSACGGAQLTCNDDSAIPGCTQSGLIRDSLVSTALAAGQNVKIRVSHFSTTIRGGNYILHVNFTPTGNPANDDCVSPTTLTGVSGQRTGSLLCATNDGTATCGSSGSNPDVWFRYTVPNPGCAGTLIVDTCGTNDAPGANLGTDTVLAAFDACGGTQLACNDDHPGANPCTGEVAPNYDSRITVDLAAGGTVLIRLSHFSSSMNAGNYILNYQYVASGTAPTNDACAAANVLTGTSGQRTGSLCQATNDGTATCGASATNRDVWFTFTAPAGCTGTLAVDTCGTNDAPGANLGTDTVLAAFDACGGTQLACNDDHPGANPCTGEVSPNYDSRITVSMVAGQNVRIRLSHFSGSLNAGNYILNYSYTIGGGPPPANDNCANANLLTGSSGQRTGNLCDATNDGSSSCRPTPLNRDVWFRYTNTAACDRLLTVDTCGTVGSGGIDAVVNAFTACGGIEIGCNDDFGGPGCNALDSRLSVVVASGASVVVRLSHFGGAIGNGSYILNYSVTAVPGLEGDMNCDGVVNNFDIDPFVIALTDPAAYAAAFPCCNINNADINNDGAVNNFDIDPFVICLTNPPCPYSARRGKSDWTTMTPRQRRRAQSATVAARVSAKSGSKIRRRRVSTRPRFHSAEWAPCRWGSQRPA
ncbi:MAG: serine protease [Phycisphaerae bacterium]